VIRLDRPAQEPAELVIARDEHLPGIRAVVAAQPPGEIKPPEKTKFTGYRAAFPALLAIAGPKCWYCERKLDGKYEPVDHYRPKQRASREACASRDGYWWLAWTWSNLILLCYDCNNHKGTWFPLAHGSLPLVAEQPPPMAEKPLLIDPCVMDPIEHIRFEEERGGTWRARPRDGSLFGAKTIEKLGLDGVKRPGILDQFREHVKLAVKPRVDLIHIAMRDSDHWRLVERWDEVCRALLRKQTPYAALSYAALDRRIPASERDEFGLVLPRPPWDPRATLCVHAVS
jgi:5-methylcytosine-specific restriction endonuclease McrA